MACYSRIQATKMTDAQRLADALAGMGWAVSRLRTDTIVGTKGGVSVRFDRAREGAVFTTETGQPMIDAVARQYAAIGIRKWAVKNRFGVAAVENDGLKLTLKRRA